MKTNQSLLLTVILFFVFQGIILSQESDLYIPREIKRAYQNGTRSFDGNPGENYFQNKTDYTISVNFDPYTRLLEGSEKILFKNNSPDTLRRVIIRLNSNILKKGVTRNKSLDPSDVTNGTEITLLKIGEDNIDLKNNPPYLNENNLIIRLPKPIIPGSQTEFEINWNYIFQANSNIREGRYHETTYFIAYWYPKIAVYDDIEGWDRHVYNAEQEFYHEYGDYAVNVTVPRDFYVWSSGLLQNAGEVLNEEKLELFEQSKTSDKVINILSKKDGDKGDMPRNNLKQTWKFKADYLPDFAFALSDTYLWDASSIEVNGERVHVHAVYYKGSSDFHEVTEISRQTIKLLSDSVMRINYPYPQMTAFNGHFGMEFPMMVNDGDADNRNETLFVTSHEIAHTYFPFLVGTNEQKYAWMDEGLVTFLPKAIEDQLSHDNGYKSFTSNIRSYSYYAGSKYDVPLMTPSDQLTGVTYMYVSYSRAGVAFYVLENILGKELFKECLQTFIQRWEGKHPTAFDLFFTFEDVSGENLNWFWKPWFYEFGYPDLGIANVFQQDDEINIQVEKTGSFPAPVNLILTFEDGSSKNLNQSAMIWAENELSTELVFKSKKKVKRVEINIASVPDNNRSNNSFLVQ